MNDKVVEIKEPLDTVSLYYNPDNDDRLAYTKTVYPDYEGAEISQIIKLIYEDYVDSKDKINNVVSSVEQRTYVKNKKPENLTISHPDGDLKHEEEYLKLEEEIKNLIEGS